MTRTPADDSRGAAPQPAPDNGEAYAPAVWTRLRDHKVLQWIVAYAAAAYTLLHAVQMVADGLDWPHVIVRVVTLLLILGVPVVVTLAWYHGHRALRRVSGAELAILTVLLVIAGSILWLVGRQNREHPATPTAVQSPPARPGDVSQVPPAEMSIAVLPFADMSAKKDQEYFADGMAEEVLDILARIPQLKVIGRTSSFQFKGRSEDLRAIGEKLGAAYVVEGSVRTAAARVRVTAQLIDTRSGTRLWTESYDRDFGDVLILQDQVATSIARALQLAVVTDESRPLHRLPDPEAYSLYLQGRAALDRSSDDSAEREAIGDFEQAIALDPAFARAHEALALAHFLLIGGGVVTSGAGWPPTVDAARRTLQLDPASSFARTLLAMYNATYLYEWREADTALDQALAAHPRDPLALYLSAWLAFDLGRHDEARRLQEASLAIDPLNPESYNNSAWIFYLTGDLAAAERAFRRSLEISPGYGNNHLMLGQILLLRGKPQAALTEMQAEPDPLDHDKGLALAYDALGRRQESDAAAARLTRAVGEVAPVLIAELHAYRGERDQAFEWLEKSIAARELNLVHKIRDDPMLAPLRGDARYAQLLRKMNLSP